MAGGHQERRVHLWLPQRGLQRLQGRLGRFYAAARVREQLLCTDVIGLPGYHGGEVHLGLAQIALLEVHAAQQHPSLKIVGIRAYQLLKLLACSRIVAAACCNLRAQKLRDAAIRRRREQALAAGLGCIQFFES